ncbi:MAG: hypothetical protein AB8B94_19225 [Hyphomicrobiales bacterium]
MLHWHDSSLGDLEHSVWVTPLKGEAFISVPQVECILKGLQDVIGGAIAEPTTLGLTEGEPVSSVQYSMEDHSFK